MPQVGGVAIPQETVRAIASQGDNLRRDARHRIICGQEHAARGAAVRDIGHGPDGLGDGVHVDLERPGHLDLRRGGPTQSDGGQPEGA